MSESTGNITTDELRSSLRVFLSGEFSPERLRAYVKAPIPDASALRGSVAALGWYGLSIPEEFGGLGLPPVQATVLFEELGRVLAPLTILSSALVAHAIECCGSRTIQAEYLPRLATGELTGALDADGQKPMRLRLPDGKYRLSGTSGAWLDADTAELLLVPAIDENERMLWVLISSEAPRINVRRLATMDRTRALCEVSFDDVLIGDHQLMNRTPAAIESLASAAALSIACDALGGAEMVLELTLDYMRQRRQFDRAIGSFQALKHRCANHKIAISSARGLLSRALREPPADTSAGLALASLAKACACDVYAAVAADGIQLHGGIGFTWEHHSHWYFRRAKLNQQLFGSSTHHLDRAARGLGAWPTADGDSRDY